MEILAFVFFVSVATIIAAVAWMRGYNSGYGEGARDMARAIPPAKRPDVPAARVE